MSCTGYVFILRLYFWQMFTVSCGKENAVVEYGGLIKVHMILYLMDTSCQEEEDWMVGRLVVVVGVVVVMIVYV